MTGQTQRSMTWPEMAPHVQTGDLFLCHGTRPDSIGMEIATESEYTHVGMFVRLGGGDPYIWEAAPTALAKDPLKQHHRLHSGVQLGPAEVVIAEGPKYGEINHWRSLEWDRPDGFEAELLDLIEPLDGIPFSQGLLAMAERYFAGRLGIPLKPTSMFCAELVATTFQRLGLLGPDPVPNWYSPGSFAGTPPKAKLLLGATLGETVHIEYPAVDLNQAEAAEQIADPAAGAPAAGRTT